MKAIKIVICIVFVLLICVPTVKFNFTPNAVSEIDNRVLTDNPFTSENADDLTESIENYVNDRIGFRSDMISAYTVLNDKVFREMVHPMYTYGKDGYVFASGLTTSLDSYTEYHEAFAKTVKEIQSYCEERNVPFVFVFNPAKPAVLTEYVSDGINYDRSWVDAFINKLEEMGVNYVDNTVTLKNEWENGNKVFNQKYDANHWNELGAFYGTNAILENLKNQMPNIYINSLDDFSIIEELKTSLLVSKFPINEKVSNFSAKKAYTVVEQDYAKEIQLNQSYRGFGYYANEYRNKENSPKVLVFQGSYMNTSGYKFLANSFSEYIHIHDYQNVLDFDYYYNIFKPDCVIFEVAEYTFSDGYFNYEKMKSFSLQPLIKNANAEKTLFEKLDAEKISVEKGNVLTKITWNTDEQFENVWLLLEEEFDMIKTDNDYYATVENSVYDKNKDILKIVTFNNNVMTEYK